jgi:hypothetical protein
MRVGQAKRPQITMLWYASVAVEIDLSHTHPPTLTLCPSALIDMLLAELRAQRDVERIKAHMT